MNNEQASPISAQAAPRTPLPRGVILIATLLTAGALLVGLLGLLVPGATLQEANLPRSLLLFGGAVTGVLAYGLFRMRRWAWGATLSFVVINLSFLLPNLRTGAGGLLGAALLLGAGIYLVLPSVRGAFYARQGDKERGRQGDRESVPHNRT